jgi:peptidoglycan/LPS O-acetylase OafA/YrhL
MGSDVCPPVLGMLAAACAAARRIYGRGRLVAALIPAVVLLAVGLSGKAVASTWIVSAGSPTAGWDGDWHSVVVRSFWGQADLFTFGIVVAVIFVRLERELISLPRWWRWPVSAGVLGAAVAIAVLADRGLWSAGHNPCELTGALGCALLLALVVLPPAESGVRQRPLVRLLTTRAAVVVGLCSYSIFLWHEPLVRLLRSQGDLSRSRWLDSQSPFGGGAHLRRVGRHVLVGGATSAATQAPNVTWRPFPALATTADSSRSANGTVPPSGSSTISSG